MKSFIVAATLLGAASAAPATIKRDSTVTAYSQIVDGLNAAVSAPDYLTYHQLNGYDISSCRNYCTSDPGNCQSFNIFREFGTTSSSDPVYKCSLFSQRHTAADATNKGGQDQGYGQLTRIEWSQIQQRGGAYSVTNLKGAIDANAAGGYLGTSDIGYAYDPSACANACDKTSGCSYANLWQGWSQANGNDKPTCALFSSAAHPSGADTNYGQGSYYVTNSNLYTKTWN